MIPEEAAMRMITRRFEEPAMSSGRKMPAYSGRNVARMPSKEFESKLDI
jgi:hypothetical protein